MKILIQKEDRTREEIEIKRKQQSNKLITTNYKASDAKKCRC